MELDKRIKDDYRIFTCFDAEQAKQYVDTKGYFTNDIDEYRHLDDCYNGTLNVVDNNTSTPFLNKDFSRYFNFFLPENFVKQKQKKYRPYTLQEFCDKFTIGQPIKFRMKGMVGREKYLILNGYRHERHGEQLIIYICIGSYSYTLDQLFNDYVWQDPDTGDWKLFEIEE